MKDLKYGNNSPRVIFCKLVLGVSLLITALYVLEMISVPVCYILNNNNDFKFKTGCRMGCFLNNVNKCKCSNGVEIPKCVGGSDIIIGGLSSLLIFTVGFIIIYGLIIPILNCYNSHDTSKIHEYKKCFNFPYNKEYYLLRVAPW
jgi:hypothetical protein